MLVPSCGALLGVTSPRPTPQSLAESEGYAERKFDFVYRFHDINDAIPTEDERAIVAGGRILHLSVDARDFAADNRESVPWKDVASGRYDEFLKQQGAGIASLQVPVFLTFDHEPDQPKEDLGAPSDFIAAWRHVHDVYTQSGATNAVWVWVVMGWEPTLQRAAMLWPGRDYVDWVSWEGYNPSGCRSGEVDSEQWTSFEDAVLPALNWLSTGQTQVARDLPIMISEAGTSADPTDLARTADWYAGIPQVLKKYPQVKAVGLWDHTGVGKTCDFRFSTKPTLRAGVRQLTGDPWVNTQTPRE